ncbi:MAG: response regulator [Candidatus Viridilinea halotolerans]|uniref:Circadian input-output histidine kinase CikA n=1 Tax=Candidatus Viridilinea halotolerans TaxID=2491704 RepID=A0A426TRL9_9CHLR|nr:MAG: response regulator [Candidatus Viridilinea halotolerans]
MTQKENTWFHTIAPQILAANTSAYLGVDATLCVNAVAGHTELLGATEPLAGQALLDLLPELYGNEESLVAVLTGAQERFLLSDINRSGPGGMRYLDLLTLPKFGANGTVDGLIQVVTDVTERGLREQMLTQQRNELQLLKDQVLRQNVVLARMNADLQRATRLKDEFLAGMSHEVRTPLTAILGIADLMRAQLVGNLSPEQIDMVQRINESGRHLLGLINDFLDLAKIEAGNFKIQPTLIPIHLVCDSSLRILKDLALRKQITVECEIETQVNFVRADMQRLRQMLINLLSNAIKFTPTRGRIGLKVEGNLAAQAVSLTVWDTGIGISAEDLTRLFQPFVQIQNEFQQQHKGSGLGLALVSQLTELHGGGLVVTSEVGQGSQFTLTLPWLGDEQEKLAHSGALNPVESEPVRYDLPLRDGPPAAAQAAPLLLIEDHQPTAQMLSDLFNHYAYNVIVAESGEEALAHMRETPPCLVITDVRLHAMSGIELMQQMRQSVALHKIPIIALTTLAMPGDRERCLDAGADRYLSKPVPLRDLLLLVEELLGAGT